MMLSNDSTNLEIDQMYNILIISGPSISVPIYHIQTVDYTNRNDQEVVTKVEILL